MQGMMKNDKKWARKDQKQNKDMKQNNAKWPRTA